jgi:hypothetical protein
VLTKLKPADGQCFQAVQCNALSSGLSPAGAAAGGLRLCESTAVGRATLSERRALRSDEEGGSSDEENGDNRLLQQA